MVHDEEITTARVIRTAWRADKVDDTWSITTIKGDPVAQEIPTQEIANSIAYRHNENLAQLRAFLRGEYQMVLD